MFYNQVLLEETQFTLVKSRRDRPLSVCLKLQMFVIILALSLNKLCTAYEIHSTFFTLSAYVHNLIVTVA